MTGTRRWGAWTLSLLLEFLASTGLRIGEAAGLEWRHLELGTRPHVKVRQRVYRRELGPPKTKKGRRNVPLNPALAAKLRELRAGTKWGGDRDPVFANERGNPFHASNIARNHLRTILEEVEAPWASFHTFRHTCASLLFAAGKNAVQVQEWLGHSSPKITLDVYTHLLDGELGGPLDLGEELREVRERKQRESLADLDPTPASEADRATA